MHQDDTSQCFQSHLGIWCIEALWMQQALAAIQSGMWKAEQSGPIPVSAVKERPGYELAKGVAVIPLHGHMMKARSKFGGASTVQIRQMIREASRDPEVKTLLLHIDSPGGHVAGTQELADDIYRVRASGKTILAHIDDLGASGAYWAASQCTRITANQTAEVGSIGTVAILEDNSARMERLGVRVHVVSTGPYKGLGVEGTSISSEGLAYIRTRVENLNEHFQQSLRRGRTMKPKQLADASDGRVHIAAQALHMGLIDHICSFEQALEEASQSRLTDTNYRGSLAGVLDSSGLAPGKSRLHYARSLQAYRYRHGV